jgi:predicted RecA/RadA family phage recombinase
MATYVSPGNQMQYKPTSPVAAGDVVVLGSVVGVATAAIAANVLGDLTIEGVFNFPKAVTSTSALGPGVKVYWDPVNQVVTSTAGQLKVAGYTVPKAGSPTVAAAVADTTVGVKLARA